MRLPALHHLSLATALTLAACGAGHDDSSVAAAATATSTPVGEVRALQDGWYEAHPEPNLVLRLRQGWTANRAEGGVGPITFSGPNGARVVVWPMFVDSRQRMPAQFSILTSFAQRVAGDFTWSQPAPFGRNGERMFGRSRNAVAQATFTYTQTPMGLAGYWYLTAARAGDYAALRPVFAGLMQGVRIFGPAGGGSSARRPPGGGGAPPAPALRFVRWQEPNEGAYITEVPERWRVSGGVLRPDPQRLLDTLEMQSPDNQIYAFSGDRTLPVFKTPTRAEAAMGMVEGSNNGNAILLRYQPAAQFLPQYLTRRFRPQCREFQIMETRDQPEISAPINRSFEAGGRGAAASQRVDVAMSRFRCGGGAIGVVQLATYMTWLDGSMTGVEGFGIWQISGVAGFIAPEPRVDEAGQAIIRTFSARRVNPQWAQGNQAMVAAINGINAKAAESMNAMIAGHTSPSLPGSAGPGSGSGDDLVRQRENAMLDQTDVIDQRSGERYKVVSGSNYYWINPQGTIVGSNAPAQPTTDFQAMTQLP